jgi:hypothetical protein
VINKCSMHEFLGKLLLVILQLLEARDECSQQRSVLDVRVEGLFPHMAIGKAILRRVIGKGRLSEGGSV